MTVQQFFGALVRALGLYWLTNGLSYLPSSYAPVTGYSPGVYLIVATVEMIVGVILMFKADRIVKMCYTEYDSDGYPIA